MAAAIPLIAKHTMLQHCVRDMLSHYRGHVMTGMGRSTESYYVPYVIPECAYGAPPLDMLSQGVLMMRSLTMLSRGVLAMCPLDVLSRGVPMVGPLDMVSLGERTVDAWSVISPGAPMVGTATQLIIPSRLQRMSVRAVATYIMRCHSHTHTRMQHRATRTHCWSNEPCTIMPVLV